MNYREAWITEHEIQDQLEANWDQFFNSMERPYKLFREMPIGGGFADFVELNESGVEIFEVKITASIASIKQALTYKESLSFEIFNLFYETGKKPPHLSVNLIARYIDADVIDLAQELGIALWRVKVSKRNEISVDVVNENCDIPKLNSKAESILSQYYGPLPKVSPNV